MKIEKIFVDLDGVLCDFHKRYKEIFGVNPEKLKNMVEKQIEIDKNENPVILYSCSFPAKLMSDIFYKKYKKSITQIDMGAIWDPYCGKKTRPYHEKVMQRINNENDRTK